MKKSLSAFLAIYLVFGALAASAATPPKAGSSCTKLGQTQTANKVKYTCIKSGKKLVWDKGISLAKPTSSTSSATSTSPSQNSNSSPSTLPSLSSIKTDLSSPVIIAGYQAIRTSLAKLPNSSTTNIKYLIDNGIDPKVVTFMKEKINLLSRFYLYSFPTLKVTGKAYFYPNSNFDAMATILKESLDSTSRMGNIEMLDSKAARAKIEEGFFGGGAIGYDKSGDSIIFFYMGKNNSLDQLLVQQIFVHETTHFYQRAILSSMAPMTCWIREGQAVFLGMAVTADTETQFADFWKYNYSFGLVANEPSMKDYYTYSENDWYEWLKQQETHPLFDCDPYLYYHTGMIIWSYIYGTYGPYNANDFFREISKYPIDGKLAINGIPQTSWKKAYETVFGVKVEDDYKNWAKFIYNEAKWGKTRS